MLDFFAASRPKRVLGVVARPAQAGWVAVAAIALLGGCSWFSDEPTEPPAPVTIDSPAADASVPAAAPTPTVSVIDQAPQGLGSDSASAQYGEELTMPSVQAPRPEAPPPVEVPPAAAAPAADGSAPESSAPEAPAPETPAPEAPADAPVESAPEAPAPQSWIEQTPLPTPVPTAGAAQPMMLQVAMATTISSAC